MTTTTGAWPCGIPGCSKPKLVGHDICEEHHTLGYGPDYRQYQAMRDEGYSHLQAAVECGLMDPPEID